MMDPALLKLKFPLLCGLLLSNGCAHQSGIGPPEGGTPAIVREEFICEQSPTPSSHASTIVETPSGLVAAWFGGLHERATDVGIWLARHDGNHWSRPEQVATGRLPDGGTTWSVAHRLPAGLLGPIKNKPVQLADGTIISPSSTEAFRQKSFREVDVWKVHLELSTNWAQSWTKVGPLADPNNANVIQPTVLVHRDGQLQILCRSQVGRIQESWSKDHGRTWSAIAPIDLPNPDAGIDAVNLRDGRFLLVYNHSERKGDNRRVLNVAVSSYGQQWNAALVLENQRGEYSYPAVIQTADGLVHITYTWNRKRIKHVVLNPAALVLRPIHEGRWPSS